MTHIYFIRHAEPNYDNQNDRDRELSEKGMADRGLVSEFLKEKEIDVVLSSPYKRAVDTIKEFADTYGYEINQMDDFRERKVDGGWIDDFHAFSKRQWEDFDYKLTDGESLNEVQQRNISALTQVLQKYQNKRIVIGSHGTALSTIINFYQPAFSFLQFEQIKTLMPWGVHFVFDGETCIKIEEYNFFTKKTGCIYNKQGI